MKFTETTRPYFLLHHKGIRARIIRSKSILTKKQHVVALYSRFLAKNSFHLFLFIEFFVRMYRLQNNSSICDELSYFEKPFQESEIYYENLS